MKIKYSAAHSIQFTLVIVTLTLACAPCRAEQAPQRVNLVIEDATTASPLANVSIDRLATDGPPEPVGITDGNGRIQLSLSPDTRSGFIALAQGHAPTAFGFWGALPADYRVTMKKATHVAGRLTTADGAPAAAGTPVTLHFTLWGLLMPFNGRARLGEFGGTLITATDAHGRFEIEHTGDPGFMLDSIEAKVNGVSIRTGRIDPRTSAYKQLEAGTLLLAPGPMIGTPPRDFQPRPPMPALPPLTIHLRVVDDRTGQPIAPIQVSPGGQASPDQSKQTRTDCELTFDHADVTWRFTDGAFGYFLRVRADGYGDQATRLVKDSEGVVDLEMRLAPATKRSFTVLTSAGKPADAARAYVVTPTLEADVSFDATPGDEWWHAPSAVADANGTLTITEPGEVYRLAIANTDGWAEVNPATLAANTPVRLTPWAKATLHLLAGERPLEGVAVEPQSGYSEDAGCWIDWSSYQYSDANGTVELAHLKTEKDGGIMAAIMREADANESAAPNWDYIDARWSEDPGQSKEITYMGGPHALRARLLEQPGYHWQSPYIDPVGRAISLPVGLDKLAPKAQEKAVETAVEAAGNEKPERSRKPVQCQPTSDGSIGAVGLEPGTYHLTAYASSPAGTTQPAMQINQYVVIADDGPALVDLGVLKPHSDAGALGIGKAVPELAANLMDGKAFKLSALKGKWVLLDFWGTWCGFCVAEEPTMKDAFEGWSADGRLTIVALSVDDTVQKVKDHVAQNELPWTQVVLGDRAGTDIPQRFGVDGYPTTLLIAPDGTLAADDLRGGSMRQTLIEKLGPPSPPKKGTKPGTHLN